jgi:hypothetical protein
MKKTSELVDEMGMKIGFVPTLSEKRASFTPHGAKTPNSKL